MIVPLQRDETDVPVADVVPVNATVLHTFTGVLDGGFPNAGLAMESTGNLFGTAESHPANRRDFFNTRGMFQQL
jgi:hypothetical protein